jgi:hypothetical protein
MEYNINMLTLSRIFPEDTLWWTSGAEICGYSPSTYKLYVITDGCCYDDCGTWLVHAWRLKEPWDMKTPIKYVDDDYDDGKGVKIMEQWLMFRFNAKDVAPIREKYEQQVASRQSTNNHILFIEKDGLFYTFGSDALKLKTWGHPMSHLGKEPVFVCSSEEMDDVCMQLRQSEVPYGIKRF